MSHKVYYFLSVPCHSKTILQYYWCKQYKKVIMLITIQHLNFTNRINTNSLTNRNCLKPVDRECNWHQRKKDLKNSQFSRYVCRLLQLTAIFACSLTHALGRLSNRCRSGFLFGSCVLISCVHVYKTALVCRPSTR